MGFYYLAHIVTGFMTSFVTGCPRCGADLLDDKLCVYAPELNGDVNICAIREKAQRDIGQVWAYHVGDCLTPWADGYRVNISKLRKMVKNARPVFRRG